MPRGMGSSTSSNPSDTGKRSGLHGPAERHSSEYNYYSGRDSRDHSHISNRTPTDQTITTETVETEPVANETTQNMNEAFVETGSSIEPQATDYSWVTESLESKKDKEKQTAELNKDYSTTDTKEATGDPERDFDFSNLEPIETKTVGWGPFKHEEIADKYLPQGKYTPQQLQYMDEQARNLENGPSTFDKIMTGLTGNVLPHQIDTSGAFDRLNYNSAIDNRTQELIDSGMSTRQAADQAMKEVYDTAQKASLGLAKEGVEYYKLTGDTLNNPYAVEADKTVNTILAAYDKGHIDVETATDLLDKTFSVSNGDQLKSLVTSPAIAGLELLGLTSAAGLGANKVLGAAGGKLVGKILERDAQGIATGVEKKFLDALANNRAFRNKVNVEKLERAFAEGQKGTTSNLSSRTINNLKRMGYSDAEIASKFGGNTAESDLVNSVVRGSRNPTTNLYEGYYGLDVVPNTGEVARAVGEAISDKVDPATTAKGIAGAAIAGGALEGANAMDTGIANPDTGRTIDSSEIVERYQENPYRGEDAVTIQSLEGPVTLPPRQAVAVGEAENLRESDGYTEEVREAARVGDGQTAEDATAEIGAEFSEKEQIPAEEVKDLKWYERAFDYVQALLGGRDLNGDRTISGREWYESTIGKLWNNIKSIPSKISETWNSVKDFTKNLFTGEYFKRIGNAVVSSKNYIVDVATGERSVVEDVKETFAEENLVKAGTAVADKILPDWNDSPEKELMHEAITDAVSQATSEYMYGNFGPITLCKFVGSYVAGTVAEMFHLSGHDLDPNTTKAINFMATNSMGILLAPSSTVLRNVMYGIGQVTAESIRGEFDPNRHPTNYIEPANLPGGTSEATSDYGSAETAGEGTYSGYKERAKNSNIAADYNAGMEEEVNEAVSDSRVKDYIVSIYSKEPDFIRKAIQKVIKSYREAY